MKGTWRLNAPWTVRPDSICFSTKDMLQDAFQMKLTNEREKPTNASTGETSSKEMGFQLDCSWPQNKTSCATLREPHSNRGHPKGLIFRYAQITKESLYLGNKSIGECIKSKRLGLGCNSPGWCMLSPWVSAVTARPNKAKTKHLWRRWMWCMEIKP